MKPELRDMTLQERQYTCTLSPRIDDQTACIGHLRVDMGGGKEFYTSWDDHTRWLNDAAFKSELNEVINGLRKRGQMLSSRDALTKYCYAHPEAGFGDGKTWGVRADTEKNAFLLRLNPSPGEYNLYCYCYMKKWLDNHMSRAAQGIRLVDTNNHELFRISDGDSIRVTRPDGESRDSTCRFYDEDQIELTEGFFGSDSIYPVFASRDNIYHVRDLANLIEQYHLTVVPLRASLPRRCYSVLPSSGELIVVTKGETGYRPANVKSLDCSNREGADQLNRAMGVTKAQEAAMAAGSMFGWAVPAADPSRYDGEGNPIRPGNRRFAEKAAEQPRLKQAENPLNGDEAFLREAQELGIEPDDIQLALDTMHRLRGGQSFEAMLADAAREAQSVQTAHKEKGRSAGAREYR